MFCSECGATLAERAAFCHKCGTPVPAVAAAGQAGSAEAPAAETSSAAPSEGVPADAAGQAAAAEAPAMETPTPVPSEGADQPATSDVGEASWIRYHTYLWSSPDSPGARRFLTKGQQVKVLERIGGGKVRVMADDGSQGWLTASALSLLPVAADAASISQARRAAQAFDERGYGRRASAGMPRWLPVVLVVLAAVVIGVGLGGRVAASAMADPDCWELGGDEGIAIRGICAGDRERGGWCAGLQPSSADELDAGAAACAFPALVLQEIPLGVAIGVTLVTAGILLLPLLLLPLRGGGGKQSA